MRDRVAEVISRLRDRRRKTRQRLEDIFDRKTFISVLVLGPMGKLVEVSIVPYLDAQRTVDWSAVGAWAIVFAGAVVAAVYWHWLAKVAEASADVVEETVDPEE